MCLWKCVYEKAYISLDWIFYQHFLFPKISIPTVRTVYAVSAHTQTSKERAKISSRKSWDLNPCWQHVRRFSASVLISLPRVWEHKFVLECRAPKRIVSTHTLEKLPTLWNGSTFLIFFSSLVSTVCQNVVRWTTKRHTHTRTYIWSFRFEKWRNFHLSLILRIKSNFVVLYSLFTVNVRVRATF